MRQVKRDSFSVNTVTETAGGKGNNCSRAYKNIQSRGQPTSVCTAKSACSSCL